ncbi:hypothetical protein RRG08_048595 [Elysia crispata]|uniref:Uncharacterized protein n=1 Tax=Elysia crispata TaxID=231223 RepID=A0AAE1DWE9_9GAST|nr:hypothetical protein RRG08_048595 [Elysia crispata]
MTHFSALGSQSEPSSVSLGNSASFAITRTQAAQYFIAVYRRLLYLGVSSSKHLALRHSSRYCRKHNIGWMTGGCKPNPLTRPLSKQRTVALGLSCFLPPDTAPPFSPGHCIT